jgi:hypothetical protein
MFRMALELSVWFQLEFGVNRIKRPNNIYFLFVILFFPPKMLDTQN